MDNKILFDNKIEVEKISNNLKKEIKAKPNLFQGRTDSEIQNSKFPDWDITPPNQFINPRIKKR